MGTRILEMTLLISSLYRTRPPGFNLKIPQYTYSLLIAGMILSAPLHASDLMLSTYREALEGDAQYGAARAAFQAAQEKLPQGRAGFLPNITFTGNQRK